MISHKIIAGNRDWHEGERLRLFLFCSPLQAENDYDSTTDTNKMDVADYIIILELLQNQQRLFQNRPWGLFNKKSIDFTMAIPTCTYHKIYFKQILGHGPYCVLDTATVSQICHRVYQVHRPNWPSQQKICWGQQQFHWCQVSSGATWKWVNSLLTSPFFITAAYLYRKYYAISLVQIPPISNIKL